MVNKNNLTASTLKLFHDDILISELSRESIGRKNDDRFDPALRNGITQAIQRVPSAKWNRHIFMVSLQQNDLGGASGVVDLFYVRL